MRTTSRRPWRTRYRLVTRGNFFCPEKAFFSSAVVFFSFSSGNFRSSVKNNTFCIAVDLRRPAHRVRVLCSRQILSLVPRWAVPPRQPKKKLVTTRSSSLWGCVGYPQRVRRTRRGPPAEVVVLLRPQAAVRKPAQQQQPRPSPDGIVAWTFSSFRRRFTRSHWCILRGTLCLTLICGITPCPWDIRSRNTD